MSQNKIYPYYYNNRYYNYQGEKKPPFLIPTIKMFCEWYLSKPKPIDKSDWFAPSIPKKNSQEMVITWVGHSTFLIQIAGVNILTDPVFGNLSLFLRRFCPPGVSVENLPPIDYILLSHNHHDHMDSDTLMQLKRHSPEAVYLVPIGDAAWFMRRDFKNVHEFTWWELYMASGVKFTFLPARHWSQRGIFDYNKSLWGSWMIECAGQTIYFAGDTYYSNHFKAIGQEYNIIDVALLPIGPCEPNKYMKYSHINAQEAGQAFLDLNAQNFIPMHYATFPFGTDYWQLPYERIVEWFQKNMPQEMHRLHFLKLGAVYEQNKILKLDEFTQIIQTL